MYKSPDEEITAESSICTNKITRDYTEVCGCDGGSGRQVSRAKRG